MKFERAKTLELLQRRLDLLGDLIVAGAQWRRAFIAMQLDQSERCLAGELRLAAQVYALDKEIATIEGLDQITDREICEVLERTKSVQLELTQSNELRKSILKRSKITISALRNLFNSHSASYAAPVAHSTGTIYEETV
jgi:hypothetical protein